MKSAIFTVVLACFKLLEDVAVGLYRAESIVDLDGGTLRTLLTLTLVLFVVLIPFVGFGEPQRIMGEGKLKQMFFYPRSQSHFNKRSGVVQ